MAAKKKLKWNPVSWAAFGWIHRYEIVKCAEMTFTLEIITPSGKRSTVTWGKAQIDYRDKIKGLRSVKRLANSHEYEVNKSSLNGQWKIAREIAMGKTIEYKITVDIDIPINPESIVFLECFDEEIDEFALYNLRSVNDAKKLANKIEEMRNAP